MHIQRGEIDSRALSREPAFACQPNFLRASAAIKIKHLGRQFARGNTELWSKQHKILSPFAGKRLVTLMIADGDVHRSRCLCKPHPETRPYTANTISRYPCP